MCLICVSYHFIAYYRRWYRRDIQPHIQYNWSTKNKERQSYYFMFTSTYNKNVNFYSFYASVRVTRKYKGDKITILGSILKRVHFCAKFGKEKTNINARYDDSRRCCYYAYWDEMHKCGVNILLRCVSVDDMR